MSEFWSKVFNFLVSTFIKQTLQNNSTPGTIESSITTSMELPTFSGNVGPPEGMIESRDINDCHPQLAGRFRDVAMEFKLLTGLELYVTCTYRSKDKQNELYQIGRRGLPDEKKVTNLDGYTKRSRHNVYPAEAIDVSVDSDPGTGKHLSWNPKLYYLLGDLCTTHGLIWGGTFSSFGPDGDYPHIELPAELA